MSEDYRDRISELLVSAEESETKPAGLALAEEAVQLADAHGDELMGLRARNQLISNANWCGYPERMLVAFSWCLGYADRKPGSYYELELLWKYKWVIAHLADFPDISRDQILAALDDFTNRCKKAGYNERSSLSLRRLIEEDMGNLAAAAEWHAKWKLTRRDTMSDCPACEANRLVSMHARRDEDELAIRAARPILSGRMKCAEVPHGTYANLLRSAWRTGRRSEAEQWHNIGYRLIRGNREFIADHAQHLGHLLRSNQLDRALPLFRTHLPWALETKSLDRRFFFLVAASSVARCLLAKGTRSVRIRIAKELCPVEGRETLRVKEFSNWITRQIDELASRFDRRNGNRWFTQYARTAEAEFP